MTASRAFRVAMWGNLIAAAFSLPSIWLYLGNAAERSPLLTGFAFGSQIWAAFALWMLSRVARERWGLRT